MYLKTLCERFMDGDQTVGGEISKNLYEIRGVLDEISDLGPGPLIDEGAILTGITIDGDWYFFDFCGRVVMIPVGCIESYRPDVSYAFWYLQRILLQNIPEKEALIQTMRDQVNSLKRSVNFSLYRLQTERWEDL